MARDETQPGCQDGHRSYREEGESKESYSDKGNMWQEMRPSLGVRVDTDQAPGEIRREITEVQEV